MDARKSRLLGVGVGVAISIPVVGLLLFVMRPATLALDWPLDERQGSRLLIDGQPVDVPAANPAELSLKPGKHRIVLQRRGYDPLEWTHEFARGDRREQQVEWKQTDFSQGFGSGASQ